MNPFRELALSDSTFSLAKVCLIRSSMVLAIVFFSSCFNSCTNVKAYQKMYVNDKDMVVSTKSIEQFEGNMEVFREGAAGANGGKSGGGCACN